MKKRITYEIRGQVERNCFFRVGKALVRVEFTGGAVNSAGITPAQYITDNPLYQSAIENSADYRNGIIRRGAVDVLDDNGNLAACENEKIEEADEKTFPNVSNTQQARAVLMGDPYKCPLSQLQNKHAVRAKAEELGISFPNWL
ncbi:MAG: hypothetical protein IJY64_03995 [Bacteroidaceae bacterium]|nr:hypothetical protein [Bacteroidaceae bacterium]